MTAPDEHSEDDIALAGEYVLRLLSPEDERAFAARLAEDPALRRLVADWEDRLADFADAVPPVAPPPRVLDDITATLFPEPAPARAPRWRLWGSAAAGLALIAAAVVFLPDLVPDPGPAFRAEIVAEDASLVVAARLAPGADALTVTRTAGGPRPGRTLELWLIAAGSDAPVSLGLVEDSEVTVPLDPDTRQALAGGVLAISDEPEGDSPTGAPTKELVLVVDRYLIL